MNDWTLLPNPDEPERTDAARDVTVPSPSPVSPRYEPASSFGAPTTMSALPAPPSPFAPPTSPAAPAPFSPPVSAAPPAPVAPAARWSYPAASNPPAAPYRVGGSLGWPSGPPAAAPAGPPAGPPSGPFAGYGAPHPSAPRPPGPGTSNTRKLGPLVAGILAIVVIVGLLAGLVVAVRDDDAGSVQPAIDRNGAVTDITVAPPVTESSGPPVAGNGDEPIADVARAVGPAVVLIATAEGEGSGIIYDKSGLIVTNAHVVGTSTIVQVQLADGTLFDDAKVVGVDTVRDVAVVKVNATKDLPAASFGKTDNVRVGQTAVAIGSPFGLEQTVTAGIVSAVGRVISSQNPVEMIQTDAPINRGNSGGALADKQGRVIGMNTSIRTTGNDGGSVGVGFAVPADTFLAIAGRIAAGQSLAVAYLGITGAAPTGGANAGVVISTVRANSPALAAGLKPGDLITALNGTKVTTMLGMSARVQLQQPGDVIELTVQRDGSTLKIKVTLGALIR